MPEEFTQDEFLVMELACGKLTNSITSQDEFEIKYANLAALNLFQVFRVRHKNLCAVVSCSRWHISIVKSVKS